MICSLQLLSQLYHITNSTTLHRLSRVLNPYHEQYEEEEGEEHEEEVMREMFSTLMGEEEDKKKKRKKKKKKQHKSVSRKSSSSPLHEQDFRIGSMGPPSRIPVPYYPTFPPSSKDPQDQQVMKSPSFYRFL